MARQILAFLCVKAAAVVVEGARAVIISINNATMIMFFFLILSELDIDTFFAHHSQNCLNLNNISFINFQSFN